MSSRRFALLLALCLALPAHAVAGDAAHFYVYKMQPGAADKFEQGYRRHLQWHRAHRDPLAWYGWSIEDGERSGYFVDASVGEPFAAFDRRVDVAGDGADFRANAAPYAVPMGQPAYVLLREASTGTPLEDLKPSATMQVTHVRVRLGMEARFEHALSVARQALQKLPGAPAHTWYRLVTGGDTAQYMLLVARDGWAGYDRFERSLGSLLAGDEAAQRDVAEAVQSATTETW
ncbi:hypothetical protein, partial [Frateuria sp. Soil773]|uniref:hypothetical protein n=1 Tax=Frateuria sp. Soil773 TaxID=1736407 RepID=UPI00138F12FD